MNEMVRKTQAAATDTSLDPQDWNAFRALAHRMLDETIDGIANIRARPVWQPIPEAVHYRVYRSSTGPNQGFTQVAQLDPPSTTWDDPPMTGVHSRAAAPSIGNRRTGSSFVSVCSRRRSMMMPCG